MANLFSRLFAPPPVVLPPSPPWPTEVHHYHHLPQEAEIMALVEKVMYRIENKPKKRRKPDNMTQEDAVAQLLKGQK